MTEIKSKETATAQPKNRKRSPGSLSFDLKSGEHPGAKPVVIRERAPSTDEPLDGAAAALFERLRKVRKELADSERLPPYCIAHDRTLRELARERPQTIADLRRIRGFGPKLTAKYGNQFSP